MQIKEPTVTAILDWRRKNVTISSLWRLEFQWGEMTIVPYSIGIDLTEDEFQKSFERNPKYKYKHIKNSLDIVVKKADGIIDGLMLFFNYYDSFKINLIRIMRNHNPMKSLPFYSFTMSYPMKWNWGNNRVTYLYKQAVNSILDFDRKKNLYFEEISSSFLVKYEKWMQWPGRSGILIAALMSINSRMTILEFSTCIDGIKDSELEFEMPPDYIFLNVDIPLPMELSAWKKIKDKKAYKDVPMIIMSISTDYRDREDCIRASASAYLVKPNSYDELVKSNVPNIHLELLQSFFVKCCAGWQLSRNSCQLFNISSIS